MNLSPQKNFYLSIFIFVAAVAGLCFLPWYVFSLIIEEGNKIQSVQSETVTLNKQRARINELIKEYERVEESALRLEQSLLSSSDKLKFILLIEELSRDTNVEHLLDVAGADPEAAYFNISAFGSFSNVLKFIYLLENAPYYISIRKIQITKGSAKDGSSIVRAQMFIKVFAQ